MPVSAMKFVTVGTEGRDYKLTLFRFGGDEFFSEKGYGDYSYVAGIILGPNSGLLIDAMFGRGGYAVEKAGYSAGELSAAWEYILRRFDNLPERSILVMERSADVEYGWKVKEVIEWWLSNGTGGD